MLLSGAWHICGWRRGRAGGEWAKPPTDLGRIVQVLDREVREALHRRLQNSERDAVRHRQRAVLGFAAEPLEKGKKGVAAELEQGDEQAEPALEDVNRHHLLQEVGARIVCCGGW